MNVPAILRFSALSLFVCAMPSLHAATVMYWADGVTKTSGWESFSQGGTNLCFAATASNLLAHYFRTAAGKGFNVSENAPTKGQDIFNNYYCATYDTTKGGHVYDALENYISTNAEYFNGNPPTVEYKWPSYWDSGEDVSAALFEALSNGVPAGISYQGTANHAVTVWAIQYNEETQRVSKIWVTDSSGDDSGLIEYSCVAIKGKSANFYFKEIIVDEENGSTSESGSSWVTSVSWLKYPTIPEPSMMGLLAGTLALALCVARRKRNRVA